MKNARQTPEKLLRRELDSTAVLRSHNFASLEGRFQPNTPQMSKCREHESNRMGRVGGRKNYPEKWHGSIESQPHRNQLEAHYYGH